jgi:hypothetical protein
MVCTEVFAFAVLETPKSAKVNFTKEGKDVKKKVNARK